MTPESLNPLDLNDFKYITEHVFAKRMELKAPSCYIIVFMEKFIEIVGAKSHNLKNITCRIPRGKITVITGVSGSGKSTLAFDTLFAEGQRRYIESLSTYARQFLEKMDRPDVEAIHGIPPAIAIEQKNTVKNARSTVGTASEIYDYLRLLFAKIGEVFCPDATSKSPEIRWRVLWNRSCPDIRVKRLLSSVPVSLRKAWISNSEGKGPHQKWILSNLGKGRDP